VVGECANFPVDQAIWLGRVYLVVLAAGDVDGEGALLAENALQCISSFVL
jgi:hypothetical protein